MGHGIADGVELAPLPRDPTEGRGAGRLEASMVVADDEFDAPHSPRQQARRSRDAVLTATTRVSITMPDPEDLPLTAARSAFRMGHF